MGILAALVAYATLCAAHKVTVVIDDTLGDAQTGYLPIYTSKNKWNARDAKGEAQCPTCVANPSGSQMLKGTWHDETTYPDQIPSNVSFQFSGSVIRVYCALLTGPIPGAHSTTRLAFYLDDDSKPVGQFLHIPDAGPTDYSYQQLVYENTRLSSGHHTMIVSNWPKGDSGSLALFDYAEYELDVPDAVDLPPSLTTASIAPTDHSSSPSYSALSTTTSTFLIATPTIETSFSSATSNTARDPSSSTTQDTTPSASLASNEHTSRPSAATIGIICAIIGSVLVLVLAFIARCAMRRQQQATPHERSHQAETLQAHEIPAQISPFPLPFPESSFPSSSIYSKGTTDRPSSMATTSPLHAATSPIDLHDEMAQMRSEIERLRCTVEAPPQYDLQS